MLAGAMLAAAGVGLWHIPAVLAEDAIVIDGQDPLDDAGGGMRSSNPRVKSILASHPDQFVVLCVAGCGGKTRIVQMLPKPVKARTAEFLPSAAGPEYNGRRATGRFAADESDDVVCVAGCAGRPGQVVQRNLDLPAPVVAKPKDKTSDAAPPAPASPPDKRPEPLDIDP